MISTSGDKRTAHSAGSAQILSIFEGHDAAALGPIRVALIGTYAPRKCGIATFTTDIAEALRKFRPEVSVEIYALDDPAAPLQYEDVTAVVSGLDPETTAQTARRINDSGVDAVWLQHEYGIFGGDDGKAVCDLVDRLAAPLILTCHTVLSSPTSNQRAILRHLVTRASQIMVMSQHSRDLLASEYGADPSILRVIEHGSPDRPFGRQAVYKAKLGLADRRVLMTFGLLGPGKGLERAIEALPAIVSRHPDVVYRIVGATHPNLLARQGEAYRDRLVKLANDLDVAQHIEWDNRFLETEELLDQLEASDIYITPYPNLQQSTSGTLSYAVALGKAVISTPYLHAKELLVDGVGKLIEPESTEAIARSVNALLDDPAELLAQQRCAYARGRSTIWPRFADATARLAKSAAAPRGRRAPILATPALNAVIGMSDSTGMLQHSIGIVPNRQHGYCVDDNVRALMLMNVADGIYPTERTKWSVVYASFIQDAWNAEKSRFRNFMRFDRNWCEDAGSDDSNGRTVWTLAHTAQRAPDPDIRKWAYDLYQQTVPHLRDIGSPRAVAFQMLGAAAMLRAHPGDRLSLKILENGGELLTSLLSKTQRPGWTWFETVLGYDNPRLPQALIEAGRIMGRDDWLSAGLESLKWICDQQMSSSGVFRPVGSESFGKPFTSMPFDQQPLEAQAAIEACYTAYCTDPDQYWFEHAQTAWAWFFGKNDRGCQLAEISTGRCRDGVTPRGVNTNCGAESILAFQLSHYTMVTFSLLSNESPQGSLIEPTRETAT